jgi:hypothetical protein
MNSTKIITLIAIVVLAIGCKKEKVDNSFKSKLINKNWKSTKLISDGTNKINGVGKTVSIISMKMVVYSLLKEIMKVLVLEM